LLIGLSRTGLYAVPIRDEEAAMKRNVLALSAGICGYWFLSHADDATEKSRVTSVKLYQDQAAIVRQVDGKAVRGLNTVVVINLSPLLCDWSVRGSLPASFAGRTNSCKVEHKALVKKRQQRIVTIEEKFELLRDKDHVAVDDLKNIHYQEKFLNSAFEFANANVLKEIATRIP